MPKTFTIIAIILIAGMILYGLGKQISDALIVGERLDTAVEELSNLQKENKKLKADLENSQKYTFIEEMARNKLNLTKSNETIVIIPDSAVSKVLGMNKKPEEGPRLKNWQGWLRLFGLY